MPSSGYKQISGCNIDGQRDLGLCVRVCEYLIVNKKGVKIWWADIFCQDLDHNEIFASPLIPIIIRTIHPGNPCNQISHLPHIWSLWEWGGAVPPQEIFAGSGPPALPLYACICLYKFVVLTQRFIHLSQIAALTEALTVRYKTLHSYWFYAFQDLGSLDFIDGEMAHVAFFHAIRSVEERDLCGLLSCCLQGQFWGP